MSDDEIFFAPATELRRLMCAGELGAHDLIGKCLHRIEELNPRVNAIVSLRADMALSEAKLADQRSDRLPLQGLPITIKDNIETLDLPTTHGSMPLASNMTRYEAIIVTRLRKAGAIVLGKTNTPEFAAMGHTANPLFGTTNNPWQLAHSAGGSSGGAAASVAAGFTPIAQGNDGSGSIRGPASCCAVVGLKPSRGRVPWGPTAHEVWAGWATNGALTRTVRDSALVLDVMAGPVLGEPYGVTQSGRSFLESCEDQVKPQRIAFADVPPHGTVAAQVRDAFRRSLHTFEAMGHQLDEVTPHWAGMLEARRTFLAANLAAMLNQLELPGEALERLTANTLVLWKEGLTITATEYVLALNKLQRISSELLQLWSEYSFLLTPTRTNLPLLSAKSPRISCQETIDDAAFLYPFNATGQPAISLPCGWSDPEGLPIGLQIVGRPTGDASLLALARTFEDHAPWLERRPNIA